MRLAGVRPRDIVECDVRGTRYLAEVIRHVDRALHVRPLLRDHVLVFKQDVYQQVTARQVVAHWRRTRGGR